MIRHVVRGIFTVAAVIAVPLALAIPASAAGGWHAADLTAMAKAPAAASAPFAYESFLQGQGAVARTVYRTPGSHIEELSFLPADKKWHAADLTVIAKAPAAASAPSGYRTFDDTQTARVVYRTPGSHIEELNVQHGRQWIAADLTALTGAPAAASAPFGYQPGFDGVGLVDRVAYRTPGSHIVELSLLTSGFWHAADLSVLAKSTAAVSVPFGYETFLNGQADTIRVVYRNSRNHITQLSVS